MAGFSRTSARFMMGPELDCRHFSCAAMRAARASARAVFKDFTPFWEFVAGPLNAGTFGPGVLDNTFGPRVVFAKAPPPGQANLPPSAGYQFYGEVKIDERSRDMVVSLKDIDGATVFSTQLHARHWDRWDDER